MSRFIIYSGRDFSADFTVISSDGVTGEELVLSDKGYFSIVTSGVNKTCVMDRIPMTIIDAPNGVFELNLDKTQTALLSEYTGFLEDPGSSVGNYEGFLDFELDSGDRQAMITVYVKDAPSC